MKELEYSVYKRYQYLLFAFCFTILAVRAFTVSIYTDTRARSAVYGDGYSDINTISSAQYFLDSGFNQTAWLPVHDYYPHTNATPSVYTHYPALPNILAGIYATLFQTSNESVLRIIPLLLAIGFFFYIFHVLFQVTQNRLQALLGGGSIVLAGYYMAWADNLHQHLYGEFLKWIYFALMLRYYLSKERSKTLFAWLWLIMLLQVNISFEQPVYLGVLTLGFAIAFDKRVFCFETISAASFVLIGFGLHVYQNAIYFGSWDLALEDLKNAFFFRTSGAELGGQKAEAAFTLADTWQIPFNWFNRMERFYVIPGWAMLLLAYWVMRDLYARNKMLYKVLWALFFASIAWTFVMAQHAFIHIFVNKHFAIWYALIAAYGLPLFYTKIKLALKEKQTMHLVFYSLIILYAITMFLTQQVFAVYLKYGLAYRWMN
jgi:hypothetical protein